MGKAFLDYLDIIHNPKFTMDTDTDNPLIFLDISICRRSVGYLGHTLYRMLTHSNLYLNAKLHHYLVDKQSLLASLAPAKESLVKTVTA
jgi:hypothetical protein